jgi:tetratricopeptide (TPR) repeat protein
MLANYYGHSVSQDEIADAIYLPEIHGTLTSELTDYAHRFDLWVRQYRGSMFDLREKTAADVPLIVLGRFGQRFHYFVVLGFDDYRQLVIVHSDVRPRVELGIEEFRRLWERADRWTLLVCLPERASWKLSAEEHNDLGVFLENAGRLAAAEQHYQAAVASRPDNSYFQMNLGNVLLKERRQEAVDAFARAVVNDPVNADALNNLACAYVEMGTNLDKAVRLCRRAAELRPSHSAYYLDTLGSIYLKQGQALAAVNVFKDALAATTERQGSLRDLIAQHLLAAQRRVEELPLIEK